MAVRDEYGKDIPAAGAFHSFLLDQCVLQRTAFGRNPATLKGEERAEFVRWNVLACVRELGEQLDLVQGWKPWDQVHRGAAAGYIKDREKFIDEGVDVLHFVANILLVAGVTDTELSEAFKRKQDVNRERQESGAYAGVGDDPFYDRR